MTSVPVWEMQQGLAGIGKGPAPVTTRDYPYNKFASDAGHLNCVPCSPIAGGGHTCNEGLGLGMKHIFLGALAAAESLVGASDLTVMPDLADGGACS